MSGGSPLPFAATALLAGLVLVLAAAAARTTVRRDVTRTTVRRDVTRTTVRRDVA